LTLAEEAAQGRRGEEERVAGGRQKARGQ
jgi:hypothetical protein